MCFVNDRNMPFQSKELLKNMTIMCYTLLYSRRHSKCSLSLKLFWEPKNNVSNILKQVVENRVQVITKAMEKYRNVGPKPL